MYLRSHFDDFITEKLDKNVVKVIFTDRVIHTSKFFTLILPVMSPPETKLGNFTASKLHERYDRQNLHVHSIIATHKTNNSSQLEEKRCKKKFKLKYLSTFASRFNQHIAE